MSNYIFFCFWPNLTNFVLASLLYNDKTLTKRGRKSFFFFQKMFMTYLLSVPLYLLFLNYFWNQSIKSSKWTKCRVSVHTLGKIRKKTKNSDLFQHYRLLRVKSGKWDLNWRNCLTLHLCSRISVIIFILVYSQTRVTHHDNTQGLTQVHN